MTTNKNYSKIVWMVAFIAFAAISCWATAESLHMLLASWPKVACWIVTVGFFLISSLGAKMIVDSLNKNIYLEKRGWYLGGGILIILIFWLMCSMPTNTHTFFYRTVINDKVANDVSITRGYLGDILSNTKNEQQADLKIAEFKNKVNSALIELENEIKNESNPGFGPKSKEILRDIAKVLEVDKIEPLTYTGTTKQAREKLCDSYRTKIFAIAETKEKIIRNNILSPKPEIINDVSRINTNLEELKGYVDDGTINLNDPKDVVGNGGVCDKLNEGYNAVKKNKDFINFSTEEDKEIYTADNPVTKVKRMVSVFQVWKDFLNGEYAGYEFTLWIIISILIDIAAFISFSIAFKKTDD